VTICIAADAFIERKKGNEVEKFGVNLIGVTGVKKNNDNSYIQK
jgi:hypothetical protein